MQSPAGRHLLDTCGRPPDDLSTFVMIDGEGFWTQSTAALRVAALRVAWHLGMMHAKPRFAFQPPAASSACAGVLPLVNNQLG